jgi:hypothetical protein
MKYVFPVEGYPKGRVPLHWGEERGGSDLMAPRGTPVLAMIGGRVDGAGFGQLSGHFVSMVGEDGLDYWYAHGDRPPAVRAGDVVQAGAFLFGVGNTGNASHTDPHLHIGIGHGINVGGGPRGGCGEDFDAVALLQSALDARAEAPVDEPGPADVASGFTVGAGFRRFLEQHPEWGKARMDEQPMVGGAYLWTTPTAEHPTGGLLVYRAWLNEVRALGWEQPPPARRAAALGRGARTGSSRSGRSPGCGPTPVRRGRDRPRGPAAGRGGAGAR